MLFERKNAPQLSISSSADNLTSPPVHHERRVLSILAVLFFSIGLVTSLNDILVPYFKDAFHLTYRDAALIQFSFFAAYFVASYPAGRYAARVGSRRALTSSLWLAGCGCALFFPAAELLSYHCFLAALFVLASGVALLQVTVNAYVEAFGSRGAAAYRLTLVQAFNSLGTTIGPPFAALGILAPNTLGGRWHSRSRARSLRPARVFSAARRHAVFAVFSAGNDPYCKGA